MNFRNLTVTNCVAIGITLIIHSFLLGLHFYPMDGVVTPDPQVISVDLVDPVIPVTEFNPTTTSQSDSAPDFPVAHPDSAQSNGSPIVSGRGPDAMKVPSSGIPNKTQPVAPVITNTPMPPTKASPSDQGIRIVASGSTVYPKSAENQGIGGQVIVDAHIDASGQVTEIDIIQSSGYPELDNSFMKSIRSTYRFTPKIQGGRPVPSTVQLSHQFGSSD